MAHRILPLISLLLGLAFPLCAAAFETRATGAYIVDQTTNTVLFEKNADQPLPPASMSKLMTLNMLFEALRDGRVALDTRFSVSTKARQMGGSTMFLNERDRPTVEELIRGIIVLSGNDACVVVAEGLAGTEDAFARQMTERARALGMTASAFSNSSGWPDPNHRMSMRDLGTIALRLITEFPEYYHHFAETEFPFDNRAPDNRFNRNPLLRLGIGADGLKTGHTIEAGYGLVGSAVQGDRRVVFVITGLDSEAARAEEAEQIVNWAFRQFVQKTFAKAGSRVTEAEVWMGAANHVGLVVAEDLNLLVPALMQDGLEAQVIYHTPIQAPITQGQELGALVVHIPELGEQRFALFAETAVERGGPLKRLQTAVRVLTQRLLGGSEPAPVS